MNTLLFVTDLYYEAKGRTYYEEDLFLTSRLRESFALTICHPQDIHSLRKIMISSLSEMPGPSPISRTSIGRFAKELPPIHTKRIIRLTAKAI